MCQGTLCIGNSDGVRVQQKLSIVKDLNFHEVHKQKPELSETQTIETVLVYWVQAACLIGTVLQVYQ